MYDQSLNQLVTLTESVFFHCCCCFGGCGHGEGGDTVMGEERVVVGGDILNLLSQLDFFSINPFSALRS